MPFQSVIDNAQKADSDALDTSSLLNSKQRCIIAIPAFNEEVTIGSVVVRARKYADSIIVVDDGSTDCTADVAESVGAEVIRLLTNQGYGSAIRKCFEIAQQRDADVLVTLDGDGQHNPDDIPRLLNVMQKTGVDIVIGSRFIGHAAGQKIPRYRIFGMKLLDRATMLGTGLKLTDSQSGFRTYSRNAIKSLAMLQNGMGVGSEILISAANNNLKIEETGILVKYDGTHTPSKDPIRHGLDVITSILRISSLKYPLWFFGILGLVFLGAAVVIFLFALDEFNVTRAFITLYALGMFFFVGAGLFFIFLVLLQWSMRRDIHAMAKR
jgi:glycosyltransferase involved in cell wall biosynthesis